MESNGNDLIVKYIFSAEIVDFQHPYVVEGVQFVGIDVRKVDGGQVTFVLFPGQGVIGTEQTYGGLLGQYKVQGFFDLLAGTVEKEDVEGVAAA